ncbi:MAG: 2OG-Fe(II) oxygenase [Gammaproteobacteria bacterium]|nr:2OG-Fe(II) oxygenase [Gammaproteobacteria bacterium]
MLSKTEDLFTAIVDQLLDQRWAVMPNFVNQEMVRGLQRDALVRQQRGDLHSATVGRDKARLPQPTLRGDAICWLDSDNALPAELEYLALLESLRLTLNRALFLGLDHLELHTACYPEGSIGYQKHLDRFVGSDERLLTAILYLNDNWQAADGGALRLYTERGEVDLYPEAGLFACFITEGMWHAVLPTKRSRTALTGWFRRHQLPL